MAGIFWIILLTGTSIWYSDGIVRDHNTDMSLCLERGSNWAKAFGKNVSMADYRSLELGARNECFLSKRINPQSLYPIHPFRRFVLTARLEIMDFLDPENNESDPRKIFESLNSISGNNPSKRNSEESIDPSSDDPLGLFKNKKRIHEK